MRVLPSVCRRAALWCLVFSAGCSFACEQVPAGENLWIRLTSQVSTFNAKVGDPVKAVLTESLMCGTEIVAPVGTTVQGSVRSVRKVGWGIRHETAALRIGFDTLLPVGREPIKVQTVLVAVDNAREQVTDGTMRGIRSTYSPQGRITSRIKDIPTLSFASLNPYPDIGLLVFKATFPIFPEPEIYLPIGTDAHLQLTHPLQQPPIVGYSTSVVEEGMDPARLNAMVASLPHLSTTTEQTSADLINLVFLGSADQLEDSFNRAGWNTTENSSRKRTFMHGMYSVLNNSDYKQAPMMPFLLDGQPPDMKMAKSLNSYAKRDHLRVWRWPEPYEDETLWLSSSTRDVSASLSVKHMEFVHHIAPNIDEERSKIVRDLNAAGCVRWVYLAPRPHVPNLTQNAVGDPVRTDGSVAVVQLQDCHPPVPALASTPTTMAYKPGNTVFRYLRRQLLIVRSDLWRANVFYSAYDIGRMTVHEWKRRSATAAVMSGDGKNSSSVNVARTAEPASAPGSAGAAQ